MAIDVKSDKVRELKRDMYSLLRECLDVQMYEDNYRGTVELTLSWKMDGKKHQVCNYTMAKRTGV